MAEKRVVMTRHRQLLVAVPATVRRALGLSAGATVWWHRGRGSEVVLSASEERRAGRPRGDIACPHCEERERELVRLRGLLDTRQAVDGAAYFNQGYHAAVRVGLRDAPAVTAINDRLRRIEDTLGTRRGPWKYRVKRGAARSVELVAAPVLDGAPADTAPAVALSPS